MAIASGPYRLFSSIPTASTLVASDWHPEDANEIGRQTRTTGQPVRQCNEQLAHLELRSFFLTSPSVFSGIIARMKFPYCGLNFLATLVVGVTCMRQAARAQSAAPDEAQA